MLRRSKGEPRLNRFATALLLVALVSISSRTAVAQNDGATPVAAPVASAPPTSAPVAPPAPAPGQPIPPPPPVPASLPSPTPSPVPVPSTPSASGGESAPAPAASTSPSTLASPGGFITPAPVPLGAPTQPPIIVDPVSAGITPGGSQTLRVTGVFGTITATVADPQLVDVSANQETRTITVVGKAVGTTVITVRDDRGETREVPVRIADPAGSIPSDTTVRITGDPATSAFIKERAAEAAIRATQARAGASVIATSESVTVAHALRIDDVMTVSVPVIVQGDAYFTVQGTMRVRVVNDALPRVRPRSLLVSDFPETLKANGTLFTADLTSAAVERFLYYHYNPAGQPDRRIVLRAENTSNQPAVVQFIAGEAGPAPNEMEVGHASTSRFLVRLSQNEGSVIVVPAKSTEVLIAQPLPAGNVVSNLVELHELRGAPLHLTLLAQNASDPIETTVAQGELLSGDVPHARGVYPIPEFFFDYRYDTQGPDLAIPIGSIPLPNKVQGQTLAGDYGVLQSITIRMVNYDPHNSAQIALYANPRGGRATGTFVIDRVLVQAHALAPFAHYKLRQYTIPPRAYVETDVVTMPEGGSSYPLRLEVAPDDGSVPPGAPGSPIY